MKYQKPSKDGLSIVYFGFIGQERIRIFIIDLIAVGLAIIGFFFDQFQSNIHCVSYIYMVLLTSEIKNGSRMTIWDRESETRGRY
ncbi:MAG: hypothetical protein OXC92_00405 [Flavobacteriaceae bacterium]|nr:hypothetical protein [Flavobacteriaceae bacterium]